MERDVMKIAAGIFFMGILPVLFALNEKKKEIILNQEFQRSFIYILTLINICGILLYMGNSGTAFSVLVGSTIFRLLAVEGIEYIQGRRGTDQGRVVAVLEKNEPKRFSERAAGFIENIESSSMFLAISFILLLFLCADYLFDRGQVQNTLGRLDGVILIIVGIAYFILEGKNIGWGNMIQSIRKFFEKNCRRKIIYLMATELCLIIGSYLLTDGILSASIHFSKILPYTAGFLFLPWCMNIVNICLVSPESDMNIDHSNLESVFSVTILIGICAVYKMVYMSTYEIYDIILLSLISIFLILPVKIDSRLMGCIRVTAYFALVVYILFR